MQPDEIELISKEAEDDNAAFEEVLANVGIRGLTPMQKRAFQNLLHEAYNLALGDALQILDKQGYAMFTPAIVRVKDLMKKRV